jgi:hypothetical protein
MADALARLRVLHPHHAVLSSITHHDPSSVTNPEASP